MGELADVTRAPAGTLNATLNRAAFRLGQLAGAGLGHPRPARRRAAHRPSAAGGVQRRHVVGRGRDGSCALSREAGPTVMIGVDWSGTVIVRGTRGGASAGGGGSLPPFA
jgi:hypothetical protein